MVMSKKTQSDEGGELAIDSSRMHPWLFGLSDLRLCLDFANTLDGRLTAHPRESLTDYAALVSWSQQAGILAEDMARRLAEASARQQVAAAMALERAMALREALYRIFSAVARQRSPQTTDLDCLNAVLSEVLAALRITPTAEGFAWDWTGEKRGLDCLLWPIAQSAAALLTSGALRTVRECAAPNCGWLFLDTSRNHSRRWCDMKACGNRAKARRHYERKKNAIGKPDRGSDAGSPKSG
jgi:predicted RNA-binding Zn ribbon-like protein